MHSEGIKDNCGTQSTAKQIDLDDRMKLLRMSEQLKYE